jgi:hypothetical protein
MAWLPSYSPIVLHTKALLAGYASLINPEQYIGTSAAWAAYGNAPCSYDLYLYCNFGPVPILVISLILVFLAAFILDRIGFSQLSYSKHYRRFVKCSLVNKLQPSGDVTLRTKNVGIKYDGQMI